jgi:hypothetical protein
VVVLVVSHPTLGPGRSVSGREDRRAEASATGQDRATLPPRQPWSTFGPHAIGAERFPVVSSGLKR